MKNLEILLLFIVSCVAGRADAVSGGDALLHQAENAAALLRKHVGEDSNLLRDIMNAGEGANSRVKRVVTLPDKVKFGVSVYTHTIIIK